MLADAERRHWYWPASWRSAARVRREPSESNLQHDAGVSARVGRAGQENSYPAAGDNPGRAEVVEVIFDPGQTMDILELLSGLHGCGRKGSSADPCGRSG
jgi:hypothetical protein